MSWERLLENDDLGRPLRQRIDDLFAQQRETWPMLRDGEGALDLLQRKTLVEVGESVIVQVNPARRRSTLANTDAKAIAARACFLCPENMPLEERGVAFEDLVLLPNPFPVLPLHCTIADRQHRPQLLRGRVATFLHLAREIGPDMVALYNGARCGASAPDHFHLQAARTAEIPILSQLQSTTPDLAFIAHSSFGRNMLVIRGPSVDKVETTIERSIAALQSIDATSNEPMFNLLGRFDSGRYTVIVFPRAAHRPARYFATGQGRLLVSPAVLEMCGILVTTGVEDFERVDAQVARAIYEEVSISPSAFKQLTASVAG
jgi:uncharacterized protein DUF4922